MDNIERAKALIKQGEQVLVTHRPNRPGVIGFPTLDSGKFSAWKTRSLSFIESIVPSTNPYCVEFKCKISRPFYGEVEAGIGILTSVLEDLKQGFIEAANDGSVPSNPIQLVRNICDRFHLIVKQMRQRHSDRETLNVEDEYDVQDLFHALLHLHFEDIRPEEWAPSNAGKSTRVDFLLKSERIVVELKKTRKGLGAKEIGSELIEDKHRYKTHPDCDALICFVYDPEGRVSNPRGLENDLNQSNPDLLVEVYIRP